MAAATTRSWPTWPRWRPRVGAEVQAGEEVGTVGDTGSLKGAYLYFEIRKGGLAVDPAPWFARGS